MPPRLEICWSALGRHSFPLARSAAPFALSMLSISAAALSYAPVAPLAPSSAEPTNLRAHDQSCAVHGESGFDGSESRELARRAPTTRLGAPATSDLEERREAERTLYGGVCIVASGAWAWKPGGGAKEEDAVAVYGGKAVRLWHAAPGGIRMVGVDERARCGGGLI